MSQREASRRKAKIDTVREERRQRRREFWDGVVNGMLPAIAGELRFDPSTFEITHLEYDLTRDVDEPFLRFPKGTHFEIELAKVVGQDHYFPQRISAKYKLGKAGDSEEKVTSYSNFKRSG